MTKLSRARASTIHNEAPRAVTVAVDDEDFVVPPDAYLQVTSAGLVYLAYSGDAPMLAWPVTGQNSVCSEGSTH